MNNNRGLQLQAKYTIKRPDESDREFSTSQEAVEFLLENPGYAQLYHCDELLMSKGIPPNQADHDPQFFRGIASTEE